MEVVFWLSLTFLAASGLWNHHRLGVVENEIDVAYKMRKDLNDRLTSLESALERRGEGEEN